MTQEQFDQKVALYTYEYCSEVLEKSEENGVLNSKVLDCMRIALLLFESARTKEDMTNWHIYAEKYLLGMNEENKEIPKEG